MDEVKLLSCPTPWCVAPEPYIARGGASLWKAGCKNCKVETDAQYHKSAAVDQWNTRPTLVTDEVVERVAYSVANAKLGEGPGVRCEGPTEFEINQARQWVKRVLAAMPAIPPQSLGDHALPPSAAIAKGER